MNPMHRLARTLALPLLLLLATSCGGDGDGGGGGGTSGPGSCAKGKNSCNPGTAYCCADYAGSFTAATVQSDCEAASVAGTYSSSACTSTDRIGSCTLYSGTAAEKTIRYYNGYDASSGSDPVTNCAALHGTYTAG